MEIKEQKQVTELRKITIAHKCDNCGKIINKMNIPDEWHSFSSHHNEWGNDSIESYEHYEVCSPKCYMETLTEIVEKEMDDIRDGEVDEMEIQFARRLIDYFKSVGKNI